MSQSWPVIITDTREHVVWIEATDLARAKEYALRHGALYELINEQETLASAEMLVRSPGEDYHSWDWDTVYGGEYLMPHQGMRHDAHVEEYRRKRFMDQQAAKLAACLEAGHPNRDHDRPIGGDGNRRTLCPTCGWLPVGDPS